VKKFLNQHWPWLLLLAAMCVAMSSGPSGQFLVATIMIWAIFAIGFDLAFGVGGLLSFGHAAFYGMGGYGVAMLTQKAGLPPLWALAAATLLVTLAAAVVGLISLRMSGVFLGLTTLAIAQLIETMFAVRLREYTGGPEGLTGVARPSFFMWEMKNNFSYIVFICVVFLAVLALSALLRASPWGRALDAMRQNEVRAEQLGLDIRRLKLTVFALSGGLAALAGGLMSMLIRFINPELLRWTISGDVLVIALIGGLGTLFGPVVGAVAFGLLQEGMSRITDHWHGLLGVVLILITLFLPGGLAQLGRRLGIVKGEKT